MSEHRLQKEVFQTVLLGNGIVYVKPTKTVTIEEDVAEEMLKTCFENMEHSDQKIGLILNMKRVAFISEEARIMLTGSDCMSRSITHLAMVSDSHLSNVISTLIIQQCKCDEIKIRLFKSAENAVDWLQEHMNAKSLVELAI